MMSESGDDVKSWKRSIAQRSDCERVMDDEESSVKC